MAPTRIAIVTDIHHGEDTLSKRGTAALPFLGRFVEDANAAGVDAVVDLGDRISDEDPERDRALQGEVAALFGRLAMPRHHVDGNHDRAHLTGPENERSLGQRGGTRSVDLGPVRLAFWQPDVVLTHDRPLRLAPGDLDALSGLLAADDRPTLLFSHVPLSGQSNLGNAWFENNPDHATYRSDIAAIRATIAAAPCRIAAFSGHVHWNSVTTVDGTPHLTLQSLTETFTTAGEPSGCRAMLTIESDRLAWSVTGLDPLSVGLPWSPTKPVWHGALPRFGRDMPAGGNQASDIRTAAG
ncbi:metallophosphoesterase family protein [uncultured Enterovirga sp.]|uniref:metallophosphoesterase family protein n=1 Tax=uncultured Enterovirga sp. TaxID=2026352 RepID=UPI0035CA387A